MRRRVLAGLCGVVLAPRATGPASTSAPRAHGSMCLRHASAAVFGRPRDPDALSAPKVRAMLRDFTSTLRRRYGAADERRVAAGVRLVVPVRFHVITDGRNGLLSRDVIDRQLQSLNAAYGGTTGGADTGVSFRLVYAAAVTNAQWFLRPHDYQTQMLGALSRGGPGTLNLYTAAVGSEVLGFSSFPQFYRLRPGLDGVVV